MLQQHQASRVARLVIGALLVVLVAAPSFLTPAVKAQEPQLIVNLAGLTAQDDQSAQVVLAVLDDSSRPVVDLTKDVFAVQLNGQPVDVTGLERGIDSSQPISVLLALDVSGSMEGTALDQAKSAATDFLNSLQPNDSVGVVTFADEVNQVLPFTTDRDAAANTIDSLTASTAGGTALYQATERSLHLLADQGTDYRAVILLSDGVDNGGLLGRDEALGAAGALGVPVFTIGLGEAIDRDYLESVASTSGGGFAETPSPEGLAQLYTEAGERLRGQYVLSLDTSSINFVPTEPALLRVEIATADRTGSVARSVCARQLCAALEQVAPNEKIEGTRTVSANVISADAISSVTFLVDGEQVAKLTEPPYDYTFKAADFEAGERTLSLTVETVNGDSLSTELPINIPSAGGAMSMTTLLLAGGAILLAAIALIWFFRRRSAGRLRQLDPANLVPPSKDGDVALSGPKPKTWPERPATAPATRVEAMGRIYVEGGAMTGKSFPVGGDPLSIGSDESCSIRLSYEADDGEQIPGEYLRVWVRDELLMLHEVRKMTVTGSVGGRWAKIAPGDVVPVGPYSLRFELGSNETGQGPVAQPVPNILRDHSEAQENGTGGRNPADESAKGGAVSLKEFSQPGPALEKGAAAEQAATPAHPVAASSEDSAVSDETLAAGESQAQQG